MRFAVLGPLDVVHRGRSIEVGTTKERALLALLVLHANHPVPVETLADELWEGSPPARATSALRVYVSRLRKSLGDDSGELIATRPTGYSLAVSPDDLDVTHFEALVGGGHRDLAEGRPDLAAVRLRDALGLWRGRAYSDIADTAAGRGEATRLEELRLATIEARVEADLACGRHAEVVGELEALVTEHHLRERFWAARILALYRSGRQAEALRAYQELRTTLAEELGLEPSPRLVALERAVLAHDLALELQPVDPLAVGSPPTLAPVTRLAAPPPEPDPVSPADLVRPSGVVTLLFTDVADSTELLDSLGDEAFEALRQAHFRLLRDAVAHAGGTEVKNLGDGLMVAFPSALDAVTCAVDMQTAASRQARREGSALLGVRVGVHVGEPMQEEADYFGTPVVIAKRLCDAARSGQIVVSELVRALVGTRGGIDFAGLGALSLKGLDDPVEAHEVEWSPASPVPFPPPLLGGGHLAETGFVGRRFELAHLEVAWKRAQSGRLEVVLVAGEPGIGKTTLAARAAATAHAEGAIVMFGHCDESAVAGFQPFVEALGDYVAACPADTLTHQLGPAAADLALLLPGLHQRVAGLPALTGGGAETERYRLFEAVPAFLASVAESAPIVLVLDDLHWADRPTLQLLHHLIRRSPSVPLLVIGTYRDTDLVRTHPMAEVLVDLRRASLVDRLPLKGLSADEVLGVVAPSGAPDRDDRELANAVWEETEGSPLFVREILRHLDETGAIARDEGGRWRARRRLSQLGIPEGIKEVIGRRLSRLSDDANAALKAASVQGRIFRVDIVEKMIDSTTDALLDALDEATAAGVIEEMRGAPGRYEFTHALVREALYDELSLTRRVRMHQRVGEAIEAINARSLDDHLPELAHQFSQAAVAIGPEKAIDYGRRAGDQAMSQVAFEAAAGFYALALEAAEDAGVEPGVRADLLLALGKAQWRAKDADTARATFTAAAATARQLADPVRLGRAALGFAGAGARFYWVEVGRADAATIALLEESLAALPEDDSELRAHLLACLAEELYFLPGTRSRREPLAAEAVAMARRCGNPATLALTLLGGTLAVYGPENLALSRARSDEILALGLELRDLELETVGRCLQYVVSMEADELDTREAGSLERLQLLADAGRNPVNQSCVRSLRATVAMLEGRLDDAEREATEAFRLAQEVGDKNRFGIAAAPLVLIRRLQGRSAEIRGIVTPMREAYPLVAGIAVALEALVESEAGNLDAAQRALDEFVAVDQERIPGAFFLLFNSCAAMAAGVLGDATSARHIYDVLLPYRDHSATVSFAVNIGSVEWLLGILASTFGEHDLAEEHFTAALARSRAQGWGAISSEIETHLAVTLLRRAGTGDLERAVGLATAARTDAERLGLHLTVRRADAALALARGETPLLVEALPKPTRRDRARLRLTTGGRRALHRVTTSWSDDELVRRFGSPRGQRAMFSAMARAFQPAMATGCEGDIAFELVLPTDDADPLPPDWWTLSIRGRKATAVPGRPPDPAVILRIELPDFVRLATGDLGAVDALVAGRVHIDGDVMLAARLGDLFGAISASDTAAAAEASA